MRGYGSARLGQDVSRKGSVRMRYSSMLMGPLVDSDCLRSLRRVWGLGGGDGFVLFIG